jgi:elongation factor P--(R)-beta-lysine ligase
VRSRVNVLGRRTRLLHQLRSTLLEWDFVEAQTPLLCAGTYPDLAVDSMEVVFDGRFLGYLVNSTEFQIKRLMAEGLPRVYTLTQNFRPGDRSTRHNPEFTMLEWARLGATLPQIEADAEALIRGAWEAAGRPALVWEGRPIDLERPWERMSVATVVERVCGQALEDFSLPSLNRASASLGLPPDFRNDASLLLSYLLSEAEPWLGSPCPTWVIDWPAWMTPSAGLQPDRPGLAWRSELFLGGLELCDGFPFLVDAQLQQRLFDEELEARHRAGRPPVQLDRRYLEMLGRGLPPGAGMALGVDRLVMLLTGARSIDEVLAFPWEER